MAQLSRKAFDELYSALGALGRDPYAADRSETLRRALASKSSHLVARAAPLVETEDRAALEPLMLAAYTHLFGVGAAGRARAGEASKLDPGCHGKTALAEALDRLEHPLEGPFRRGLTHVQMEGSMPQSDSAQGLRARCGLALVRLRVGDALDVLADMLCDEEPVVRAAGAEGVAYHGDERGTALLRLKLHGGDPEPDVVSSVLLAYLRLSPLAGLERARAHLASERRSDRESAAFALGDSRAEGALEALIGYLADAREEGDARAAVAALMMSRGAEALAHLRAYGRDVDARFAAIAREATQRYDRALSDPGDGERHS
ncbi:MAG: hypothetical protein R3F49_18660 [Planctomycetota bacterium]